MITLKPPKFRTFCSAFYRFCYEGAYCPTCAIKVDINALNTTVTVNESLTMDCRWYTADIKVDVMIQPSTYPIKLQCTYNGHAHEQIEESTVGNIVVLRKYWRGINIQIQHNALIS